MSCVRVVGGGDGKNSIGARVRGLVRGRTDRGGVDVLLFVCLLLLLLSIFCLLYLLKIMIYIYFIQGLDVSISL